MCTHFVPRLGTGSMNRIRSLEIVADNVAVNLPGRPVAVYNPPNIRTTPQMQAFYHWQFDAEIWMKPATVLKLWCVCSVVICEDKHHRSISKPPEEGEPSNVSSSQWINRRAGLWACDPCSLTDWIIKPRSYHQEDDSNPRVSHDHELPNVFASLVVRASLGSFA